VDGGGKSLNGREGGSNSRRKAQPALECKKKKNAIRRGGGDLSTLSTKPQEKRKILGGEEKKLGAAAGKSPLA